MTDTAPRPVAGAVLARLLGLSAGALQDLAAAGVIAGEWTT